MRAFVGLGRYPERPRALRALRAAFGWSFAVPAVPALLVSVFVRPALTFSGLELGLLLALAVGCAAACFWLAARAYRAEPGLGSAVAASIQVAFAPLVPFLLGCAALRVPWALAALWGLAAVVFAVAFARLPAWAGPYPRPPGA
ncbi:hypothetical protein [Deinococcus maricopensis]|uniref:Uncharacterized protein n=1 Tax=Deinococcus maricopensis (strain DSM 21211 / LMG 22137 / NRRL B-23946 / LB-34) TaxID=709986 RepID=E8U5D3_DEIML|nr:hypothetical protein [Deinococcus maricopensis]ADV66272.1 hypothetical protein Deima_0615 [Deinococcus maricopensis DSM 21211]